jgi:tetratricopeptide (TPR) repeat protein
MNLITRILQTLMLPVRAKRVKSLGVIDQVVSRDYCRKCRVPRSLQSEAPRGGLAGRQYRIVLTACPRCRSKGIFAFDITSALTDERGSSEPSETPRGRLIFPQTERVEAKPQHSQQRSMPHAPETKVHQTFNDLLQQVATLHRESRHQEALNLLEKHAAPQMGMYWVWKGALIDWLGETERSESVYREGLRNPALRLSDARIAQRLARLLTDQRRYEEVLELTADGAARNDTICLCFRYRALVEQGKVVEALPKVERLAAASGSDPEPSILLLLTLSRLGAGFRARASTVDKRLRNMQAVGIEIESRWAEDLRSIREEIQSGESA